jgi:DNA primase
MASVNMAEVKEKVSIERVARDMLGLQLTQRGPDNLRAKCPICKSSDPRSLSVTPSKNLYRCFSGCGGRGGSVIDLVAGVKAIDARNAALAIQTHFGLSDRSPAPGPKPVSREVRQAFDAAGYLAKLDPAHASLDSLELQADTYREFGAGYCLTGTNRGRLAIAVHDANGNVLFFCGRSLNDTGPVLTFPNGADTSVIFNSHRVGPGELCLVRPDPLIVMRLHESGQQNVVCFLTDTISSVQLQYLSSLMDTKQCDSLEVIQ